MRSKTSVAMVALMIGSGSVRAATFTDAKFSEQAIATNLGPTAMEIAPDGRIFVCSKNGVLNVIKGGQLLPKPFLKLTVPTVSEQGLLGIALHPKFADSPYVYVYYTVANPNHNRVSRFRARGDTADGEEQPIFDMDDVTAANHMSGAIHFGNDGMLYIASGNSASSANSQNIATTLGKILRIKPDGGIPADNPFYAKTAGNARAIWTTGMRNTFTFAVDRLTGRMFGCEVGDGSEEVNELLGGSNYGYGTQEGYNPPRDPAALIGTFRPAIYSYNGGCIIAAAFYPPSGSRNFPEAFHRKFFFADHNAGWIKVLDIDNPRNVADFAAGASNPVDIKFASDGSMYYLSRGRQGGSLMRVLYASPNSLASPGARIRGAGEWTLVAIADGRFPGKAGVSPAEIRGLDGRGHALSLPGPGALGLRSEDPRPITNAANNGLFWIRYR
ncbi:MAG: hypothetical protein JWP91_4304 [Fibrobacteres bacterium]|nr:hypothetical protein [Fibrobacterota bacterium]